MRLAAAVTVLALLASPVPKKGNEQTGPCDLARAKRVVKRVYTQKRYLRPRDARRVERVAWCLGGPQRSAIHGSRSLWRQWRRRHRWLIEWRRLSAYDRHWARATGACESGNDVHASSPYGDHGSHQFKDGTWRAAGGSGDPRTHSWYEQAVRAVWWRDIAGRGQWPHCGNLV